MKAELAITICLIVGVCHAKAYNDQTAEVDKLNESLQRLRSQYNRQAAGRSQLSNPAKANLKSLQTRWGQLQQGDLQAIDDLCKDGVTAFVLENGEDVCSKAAKPLAARCVFETTQKMIETGVQMDDAYAEFAETMSCEVENFNDSTEDDVDKRDLISLIIAGINFGNELCKFFG